MHRMHSPKQPSIASDRTVNNPGATPSADDKMRRQLPVQGVQTNLSAVLSDHDGERSLVNQGYIDRIDAEEKADQVDPFLVEFSVDDPENPKHWHKAKKWFITIFCSVLCFTVAIGSSMPTGDLPGAAAYLHVSSEAINLSITLFVAGFGFGPMLFASLSEMIGRQPVYILCGFLYFIFNMQCALSKNIATLLSGRMIAGLAASAPMTNVGGSLSDIWKPEDKGIPMAMFSYVYVSVEDVCVLTPISDLLSSLVPP